MFTVTIFINLFFMPGVCSLCQKGISLDLCERGFTKPRCPKTAKRRGLASTPHNGRRNSTRILLLSTFSFQVLLVDAAFRQGCDGQEKAVRKYESEVKNSIAKK